MSVSTLYKISFMLAVGDLCIATLCASMGDAHFIAFMILAGLMWAHGAYLKKKTEEETGE